MAQVHVITHGMEIYNNKDFYVYCIKITIKIIDLFFVLDWLLLCLNSKHKVAGL